MEVPTTLEFSYTTPYNRECFIEHKRFFDNKIFTNSIRYFSQFKRAGVLLLATNGEIGPMQTEHMETACEIVEDKKLHPFAYRTHTHSLGKVVAGYKVRRDKTGKDNWIQLGKRDPLTPQMFYPVEDTDTIERGDIVAARCTMKSNRTRTTYIG